MLKCVFEECADENDSHEDVIVKEMLNLRHEGGA